MAPHKLDRRIRTLTARGSSEKRIARCLGLKLSRIRKLKRRLDVNFYTSDWISLTHIAREHNSTARFLERYLREVVGVRVIRYGGSKVRATHRYDLLQIETHFRFLNKCQTHWLTGYEAARRIGVGYSTLAYGIQRGSPRYAGIQR